MIILWSDNSATTRNRIGSLILVSKGVYRQFGGEREISDLRHASLTAMDSD